MIGIPAAPSPKPLAKSARARSSRSEAMEGWIRASVATAVALIPATTTGRGPARSLHRPARATASIVPSPWGARMAPAASVSSPKAHWK